MLAAAINLSEGRDLGLLQRLEGAAGAALLDRHSDEWHNRSVFTLAGEDLLDAAFALSRVALQGIDLGHHVGVHPRLGAVDVVPFTPVGEDAARSDLTEALSARAQFARRLVADFDVPCFFYGPERSLPEVRRRAFHDLDPDVGPSRPTQKWGACCVGARGPLVAYNLWLKARDLSLARQIASELRSPIVRTLGFAVGEDVQVSMNLIEPFTYGPMQAYDAVAARAEVARAELVGLVPEAVLDAIPAARFSELDVSPEQSLEERLRMRR